MAFRCAATAEGLDEKIAVARTNDLVEKILSDLSLSNYALYLTGKNNFRKVIYPEYKAHRTKPAPEHLKACRQYLIDVWQARVVDGCEADDALGVAQTTEVILDNPEAPFSFRTIICSIDKDLLQIPGLHYNFVKSIQQEVTLFRGLKEFYTQMLVGDVSDNVPGVRGIGPKKAFAMLDGYETEQEMFDAVRAAYNNDNNFLLTGKLLWIWREENDIWNPSHLMDTTLLEEEIPFESTHSMEEEITPSTVRI